MEIETNQAVSPQLITKKKGRKLKYASEEERKMANREYWKKWRTSNAEYVKNYYEKNKEKLIKDAIRRKSEQNKLYKKYKDIIMKMENSEM